MAKESSLIIIAVLLSCLSFVFSLFAFAPISYNNLEDLPDIPNVGDFQYLYDSYFMTRGLVLWFPFVECDGVIAGDFSGLENHGSVSGASWVDGKYGKALNFSGGSEYVLVSDDDSLKPNSITISAWVKFNSDWSGTTNPAIVDKYNGNGYILFFESATSTVTFFNQPIFVRSSIRTWVAGVWYHVVATYDNVSGVQNVYINIVLEGTATTSGDLSTVAYDMRIGRFLLTAQTLDGVIDEVRIYNRALSGFEIEALYNLGV